MTICETFALGAFRVQCRKIEFTKRGQHPVSVAGPGQIIQNEDGYLEFKVHLSESDFSTVCWDLNRPRVAGKMIPDEELWHITATGYSGEIWTGKVPDLGTNGIPIFRAGMVHGRIPILVNEVAFKNREPNQESALLFLPGRLAFPATEMSKSETSYGKNASRMSINRDHSQFESGTDEFLIARNEKHSWIQCLFKPGGINENQHVRVQEALMFALGQMIRPCAIETQNHEMQRTELRSFSIKKLSSSIKQMPPLFFDELPPRPEVFEIARRYYECIKGRKEEDWDEITCHVYYLIHSASTVQEMSSLTLSVAAEGLATACFASVAMPDAEFLLALEKAEKQLEGLTDHVGLRNRMFGVLASMKAPRNSDRLRAIVDSLGIDKQVFKAWQRTRNAAAHGVVDQVGDPSDTHARNMQVLYLCYRMVLRHIGYQGLATDYSSVGMPNITV